MEHYCEMRTIVRGTIIAKHSSINCLEQHYKSQRRQVQPVSGPAKALGQAVREIRMEHKISQEQLAFDSGFDRTYISLVERGVRSPTIRSLVRLADVLKVRPSEIMARMETLLINPKLRNKC